MPPFMVPMIGKYIPTHISKKSILTKEIDSLNPKPTIAIPTDAKANRTTARRSIGYFSTRILKSEDPAIQETIKVEKINPNGSSVSPAKDLSNGVQQKTKMYMDPSKSDEIIPHRRTSRLLMVVPKAS